MGPSLFGRPYARTVGKVKRSVQIKKESKDLSCSVSYLVFVCLSNPQEVTLVSEVVLYFFWRFKDDRRGQRNCFQHTDQAHTKRICRSGKTEPVPLPPAQFKYDAELRAPSDEYNKSSCRVGSWLLPFSNLGLPSPHRDLLYSSSGAPSSVPYLNCAGGKGNGFGLPF